MSSSKWFWLQSIASIVLGVPVLHAQAPHSDILIRNATVMTASHGTIPEGAVWLHDGKIAGVGKNLNVPKTAIAIDAAGKFVTPGIIDPHSHIAIPNGDGNEMSSPITPALLMADAFDNLDVTLYQALAGGVTTEMILHGSANVIGGQAVIVKNKFGLSRDEMLFPQAPRSIKFAIGENPKGVYGPRKMVPETRMGEFELLRQTFEDAVVYQKSWADYKLKSAGDGSATPPKRDLKMDALSDILSGKLYVQIHCYGADEALREEEVAARYGYKVRAFHHALEAYKVSTTLAQDGTAIATFADWWGYKNEVRDAIPWNAVMNLRQGVRVAIKSDSSDQIRRLNQEAGKTIHYGGATEDEALQMITLNPAWIIGVQDRVGSLDVGKDGDVVIWNMDPFSTYARAEKVFIDGELYFDSALPGYGLSKFTGTMHGESASRTASEEIE